MAAMRITVQVLELPNGGYVIADDELGGDESVQWNPTQAVSTIDEACGAVQRKLQAWASECKRLKLAQAEDANVIPMKKNSRWWRAIK